MPNNIDTSAPSRNRDPSVAVAHEILRVVGEAHSAWVAGDIDNLQPVLTAVAELVREARNEAALDVLRELSEVAP